jgi:RimJ/RimL family protein N-acetyltransferase
MQLETKRLLLRDFVLNDLEDLHEIFSDDEVMANTEPPYSKEKLKGFMLDFCINRKPKGAFAAVLKETGKVIGYVLFKSIDNPEIYETGWIFNKNFWRRGYAYEICSRLVAYGFEDMKLHKICAEAVDTDKSVPLMKKLGMQQEGVQRKHAKSNNGEWRDLHWYAILAEDWEKQK